MPGDTLNIHTSAGNACFKYEDFKMEENMVTLNGVLRNVLGNQKAAGCCVPKMAMGGMRNNFKCLFIPAGTNKGLILPIEHLDGLYEFKVVEGDISKGDLRYSRDQLDVRVIDYDRIGACKPDPKEVKAKKEVYRKQLQEELAALDAEV